MTTPEHVPSTPDATRRTVENALLERVSQALIPHLSLRCGECAGTGDSLVSSLDCRSCGGSGFRRGLLVDFRREAARDALEALNNFDALMWIAERLLAEHYPADLMRAMADDPGPKLTLALRECMEAMQPEGTSS